MITITGVLGMITDWWRSMADNRQDKEGIGDWRLLPLTPKYEENLHAEYVKALNACLEKKDVRNIALTGDYGVGKSSILSQIAAKHQRKVVQVSLLTLNTAEVNNTETSLPEQAMTPTNRIQQEIVKQLLYSANVKDMPLSRFKRIGKPGLVRELIAATYIGLALFIVMLITGWFSKLIGVLSAAFGFNGINAIFNLVGGFVLTVGLLFGVIELLQGRVHLRQLSAGPATITLEKDSASFFDQYLDEIVYFFDQSHRDIVIFEDLDRFEDPHIFETLRALNLLLNSTKKRREKPIRFIYALKDSVFDQSVLSEECNAKKADGQAVIDKHDADDVAELESVRANRTKFFDIIIPVVPFISHTTASSLIIKLLDRTGLLVSPWIADVAGRYVTDMRLLKNICNEFIIFHDRLNAGDGVDVDYSDDQIFAMMLYKNTCPKQFELLKTGKSDLDKLHADYRRLVSVNISALQMVNRKLKQEQTIITTMVKRSEEFGNLLRSFLVQDLKARSNFTGDYKVRCENKDFSPVELDDQSFWETLSQASEQDALEVDYKDRYNRPDTVKFNKTRISQVIEATLNIEAWDTGQLQPIENKIQQNLDYIIFLRSASMAELFLRGNFTLSTDPTEQTDSQSVEKHVDGKSFEAIAEGCLGKGLIFELIRRGALTRDYQLYGQTFYGNRVSAAAENFIRHQVEPNEMDVQLPLNDKDVDDVLRKSAGGDLGDRAYYNISILDHILNPDYRPPRIGLAKDTPKIDELIVALAGLGDDERDFLQAYFEAGRSVAKDALVIKLLEHNPDTLRYLISGIDLTDEDRKHWVDLALQHVSSTQKYSLDEDTVAYLSSRFDDLAVLHSEKANGDNVVAVATILEKAGGMAERLDQFSRPFIHEFISRSMYSINRPNLLTIADKKDVSLDIIKSNEATEVYPYILAKADAYLKALSAGDHSINAPASFVQVLNDIAAQQGNSEETISGIIEWASDDCTISDLTSVETNTWGPLARNSRITLNYANVAAYSKDSDLIDEDMARMLAEAQTISDVPESSETEQSRAALAVKILNSTDTITDIHLRTQLAVSLKLNAYLAVEQLSLDQHGVPAALIKSKLIADDVDTFIHILKLGWTEMEPAIVASDRFSEFMNPDLPTAGVVGKLITSDVIPEKVKKQVIDNIATYTKKCDVSTMRSVMLYALKEHHTFTFEDFVYLIDRDADENQIVSALNNSYKNLEQTQVDVILNNLPDEYHNLTVPGWDRPKLHHSMANIRLLEILKLKGQVASFRVRKDWILVYKRHS